MPSKCEKGRDGPQMGADESIGDREVEVVATETGSRQSGRPQENMQEREKGITQ